MTGLKGPDLAPFMARIGMPACSLDRLILTGAKLHQRSMLAERSAVPTMPYIHFPGTCAEALAFYADVFGATGLQTMRYAEGPGAPADWATSDRIMHGQISIDDGTLMASDMPPGMPDGVQQGVSIMQTAPDFATGQRRFDRLAEGGTVTNPFGPTFFSPGFGMVTDRFGTSWIISTLPTDG
jgi:PhnB protein